MTIDINAILSLPLAEKIEIYERLAADIAAAESQSPLPDWQVEELDRRKANLQRDPASGLSLDELERRVRARHGG